MVNAGALVTTDLVWGKDPAEKFERILDTLRTYAGNESLAVDEDAFEAEMRTADRNRATAYLMRSNSMISGGVEGILALYLRQCSVRVTCRELALMAATLSNGGVNPMTGGRALPYATSEKCLALCTPAACTTPPVSGPSTWASPPRAACAVASWPSYPVREASVSTRRGSMSTATASGA
jgi:glutaminase